MALKQENGRVIKWFIIPTMFIAFIMAFVVPELRTPGILYFTMDLLALVVFSMPRFKEEVIGVKSEIAAPVMVGAGTGFGFLILSAIAPTFSLLTPTLSLSVAADLRFFIIVFLAPIIEECWRSSVMGIVQDVYKWKFWPRNVTQSIIFAALHLFVYGVALGAYATWIDAYGAFNAVAGSIFAAFAFGMISGYMMEKWNNIVPSIISHMIINFWLVSKGLIVVI